MAALVLVVSGVVVAETPVAPVSSSLARFRVVEVAGNLANPWGMAFLPDGSLLVTERPGRLVLVSDGAKREIGGLPRISAAGQGGLLDVALHPDFEANRLVYLTYSAPIGLGFGTHVGRGRFDGASIADFEVLFSMNRGTRATQHFGSRLAFAADGTLFFTIGDRGDRNRAQDLGDHAGKVLRIGDDGSIPPDNPFVGTRGALPEIYSYGHRNAQGLFFDDRTGTLWSHEHGPRGGDEVNVIRPGLNYGWPTITYGREYSGGYIAPSEGEGLEQPVIHWTPSIAPSGFSGYSGDRFPAWRGNLFVGALAGQQLRRLVISGTTIGEQEVLLEGAVGRIRDVREGPDGYLYLLTDSAQGKLLRLEPEL